MAYVSRFKWDIFISYPMEAEAWTRRFVQDLLELDGTELPKAIDPKVFFAAKDWKLGGTSDDMLEAAENSALFVSILTRDSLSENHKRFLTLEMDSFKKTGPMKDRFCPIPLHPIDPSQLRGAMPIQNPEAFWNTNLSFFYTEDDGIPLRLRPDSEPKPGEYSKRIQKVAHRLRELLDKLIATTSKEAIINSQGPFAGKTVFLARKDTETYIEKEWLTVRSTLVSDGATVVPAAESDKVDPEADTKSLRDADLFVQLFHALDRLEDAKAQLKSAEAEAESRKGKTGRELPMLRWRKKHFDANADSNFLRNLPEEDQKFCQGSRTGTLEEFKLAISDKLQELSKPLPPPLATDQPYLYITADKADLDLAIKLQARAIAGERALADVMTRDETKQREDFVEGLSRASAIIFLYGSAEPKFIEAWLKEFIRNAGLSKLLPKFKNRKWLYQAPPEKGESGGLMLPFELRTEGSQKEFTLEGIEKICAELCGVPH
jgi:hypothetical protein